MRAQGASRRAPIWLPVLGDPTPADELVARWRGKPWYVDYGNNPGLTLPVALADRPRDARQDVHCLDLLRDNALIVAAPNRGATTAVMTMVTAGALMYRPERVQFYCIAASGPQLARLADLPHVAAVVAGSDAEGVARLMATLENIVAERDRIFTTRRPGHGQGPRGKFGTSSVRDHRPRRSACPAARWCWWSTGWRTSPRRTRRWRRGLRADAGPQLRRPGGHHPHQLAVGGAIAGARPRPGRSWR